MLRKCEIALATLFTSLILAGCPVSAPTGLGGGEMGLWEKMLRQKKLNKEERNRQLAADMCIKMATSYFNDQKYVLASEQWLKVLSYMPDNAEAVNNLGCTYYKMRQFKAAEEQHRIALDMCEKLSKSLPVLKAKLESPIHTNLGNIYRDLGRDDEAIAEYDRARLLAPTSAVPHYEFGHLFLKKGDWQTALKVMNQVLEIDALYNFALLDRAIAKYKLGDIPGAWLDICELENRNIAVNEDFKNEVMKEKRRLDAQNRTRLGA